MTAVMGPHKRLSARDGVIQFRTVLSVCIAKAIHPDHSGQYGGMPAAEVIPAPMHTSNGMDNPAVIRPEAGRTPSWRPPCVNLPQGAPAMRQIWKTITPAMIAL